jgi:hypothetical protein
MGLRRSSPSLATGCNAPARYEDREARFVIKTVPDLHIPLVRCAMSRARVARIVPAEPF